MDLYIYYRVKEADALHLQQQAAAMQDTLAVQIGVAAALKRRPAPEQGLYTFMEVYPAVPADFEGALERAVAQAGLSGLIQGARHIEIFQDATSCA